MLAESSTITPPTSPKKVRPPKKAKKSKFDFFLGDTADMESEWDPSTSLSHAGKYLIAVILIANNRPSVFNYKQTAIA
jgi:hypothetical protein